MSDRILIHTSPVTPRVRYIFGLLLGERLGLEPHFTDSVEEFDAESGPKCSYGPVPLGQELHFHAYGLLAGSGIREVAPAVRMLPDGGAELFPDDAQGALPFDPFAGAFYLITRYEEYGTPATDALGRYDATQSLSHRHGFLHIPVVDRWVLQLRELLQDRFPMLRFVTPGFRFTSTIDVDNAFAYRHKGPLRNAGGALKALLRGEGPLGRLSVLLGRTPDPYDSYDWLRTVHQQHGSRAMFFFLMADRGPFDTNLPHTSPAMRSVITGVGRWASVGIHPGHGSNDRPERVGEERTRLEAIIGTPVLQSRQHYVMLRMPHTYRNLLRHGLAHDWSMGYPDRLGFRAGTSDSFLFYDLLADGVTTLRIHPFCCMDVTLRQYLSLTPQQAMAEMEALMAEVRHVGGHFIPVWHNEAAGGAGLWKGWREVFEHMLGAAKA